MLDPEEVAAYEVWKEHKLTSSTDLSVAAFNLEMEATALAWEAGWDAHKKGVAREKNPYRVKGMSGYVPPKKVTGE